MGERRPSPGGEGRGEGRPRGVRFPLLGGEGNPRGERPLAWGGWPGRGQIPVGRDPLSWGAGNAEGLGNPPFPPRKNFAAHDKSCGATMPGLRCDNSTTLLRRFFPRSSPYWPRG